MDPAHAARAALLVARFAAAIQATKELQALQNRPQLLALEKLVFKCLDTGDAAAFLKKRKRLFRMMPRRLLEKINRELGPQWRCPPLAGVMANPRTRHISLHLDEPWRGEGRVEVWSLEELKQLCDDIAREGKNSLQSLEIESSHQPYGSHPGLHFKQLGSLLLELRALTSLHIIALGYSESYAIHHLVSILGSTNPHIRSLRFPNLSSESLRTIAKRWPQLEALELDDSGCEFDSSDLAAVLPGLRNLETLNMDVSILSQALLKVARAHDPASPPYKLAGRFTCYAIKRVSSRDMVKLFTAFPAIYRVAVKGRQIPAVCAGLQGREHVHITKLLVWPTSRNPRALEPLLARVGQHLIELQVTSHDHLEVSFDYREEFYESRVDLNMIGHYCPKLETLEVYAGNLISSDEFEVTETYFSKLRRCALHCGMDRNNPADLPDPLVCSVLASPTLETSELIGVPITEEVVAALTGERGEQGALSSLEELAVRSYTAMDVGVLAALVSHAPRLRLLGHVTPRRENERLLELKGVLASFMQQSELKASFCDNWKPE